MIIYWGTADIAKALGVSRSRAYNWYDRGVMPDPDAKTASGLALWTEETATKFVEERREWAERNLARYHGELRAERERTTEHQLSIATKALEGSSNAI